MASPFKQNKKARRRARKSAAKSAKYRENWEDRPEILASLDRLDESALNRAHAKRFQNKRFTPITMTPEQLEEQLRAGQERLRVAKELLHNIQDLIRKSQSS